MVSLVGFDDGAVKQSPSGMVWCCKRSSRSYHLTGKKEKSKENGLMVGDDAVKQSPGGVVWLLCKRQLICGFFEIVVLGFLYAWE